MARRQQIGAWGEKIAESFLQKKGYQLIDRNVRTPYGEIDLIFSTENEIIFVEVKTRTVNTFGLPEEAVTYQKQSHLVQSAEAYMQEHPDIEKDWRIDVIAVQGKPGGKQPDIKWFENAIS